MPHRITLILDTVIVASTWIASAITSLLLLASGSTEAQAGELTLLLLPLLGAVFVSGGMIMLNPNPETRRIVIGRAMLALFFGALGPQFLALVHPSLADFAIKPVILLGIGGIVAGLVYVLSKPFTRELYSRADRVAKREADRLEDLRKQ